MVNFRGTKVLKLILLEAQRFQRQQLNNIEKNVEVSNWM